MRTIGRYALLTRLGSGNIGDVFFAREREDPDDDAPGVAVKVLRPDLAEDLKFSRVLLAEAPAAIAFEHRSAVNVIAVEREGSEAHVAMELVSGQPLSLLIQRARVDGARIDHRLVAWIGAEISSVMAAAHQIPWFAGAPAMMAHGALAPRSVLLTYSGDIRVLGVGLGRARATVPMTFARLPYTSPELVKGGDPTPRADMFSLGALLYEAFSGRNIFRRANEEDTKAAIRDSNVPPLNSTNLDIDPSIGDLIAQMMAPRVDARPETMEEVSEALLAAAGDVSQMAERLALSVNKTFREERDAYDRMIDAATRAQATAQGARPRTQSGVSAVLVRPPPVQADDESIDDIPIDVGTPVGQLGDWSTDVGDSAKEEPPQELDTNRTIEDVMPRDVREMLLRRQTTGSERITHSLAERRRIGRYRVESMLARSATTVTFLARDPNVGRSVIVKAFEPDFITDVRLPRAEWVRLFKREARIGGRLSHANLPVVLDAGRDGNAYFIVTEHLIGETLARGIQREAVMSQRRVREIVVALAEALGHIHDSGIVHCDVRPSNVLLEASGRVRLMDFSMAANIDGTPHPLLASNAMTLSPEYLDGHGYGPSSDQFALGMLLYQMLVGSRPFKGLDDAELVSAIRTKTPRAPEEIESHVNPILSEMCMRMLEKDPARRYETCGAIAGRLSGSQIPRVSSDVSLVESPTTDRQMAAVPGISVESMASAFTAVCERVSSLKTKPIRHDLGDDPADAARAVARRLGASEATEVTATIGAALRDLADRQRVSIASEDMTALVPQQVAVVFDAVHRIELGNTTRAPIPVAAEIIYVVEAYFSSTRPRGNRPRISPRRAVLALKELAGDKVRHEVVAAFVEHLRETISALDLSPVAVDAPRVLVAGSIRTDALVHALEFDGFVVDEAADGHGAWEKLRHNPYRGAVIDAALPGRDGMSLIRMCRAHPDTAGVLFVLVGPGKELEGLKPDASIRLVHADIPVDDLRQAVARMLSVDAAPG